MRHTFHISSYSIPQFVRLSFHLSREIQLFVTVHTGTRFRFVQGLLSGNVHFSKREDDECWIMLWARWITRVTLRCTWGITESFVSPLPWIIHFQLFISSNLRYFLLFRKKKKGNTIFTLFPISFSWFKIFFILQLSRTYIFIITKIKRIIIKIKHRFDLFFKYYNEYIISYVFMIIIIIYHYMIYDILYMIILYDILYMIIW